MAVNITTDTNTVKVTSTSTNNVKIVDNKNNTSVSVSQPTTRVIKIATVGPQGPAGAIPNTGSFATTGSNSFIGNQVITGSLTVSGSSTFTNIGPAIFSGSVTSTQGFTGSLQGTASIALTASFAQGYVLNSSTSSLVSNSSTSSFITNSQTSSFITSIQTGSFATTGSNTFIGTQTITGSNGRLIYRGTTPVYPYTLAELHINDDYPWLERFYNDTFSTSSAVMAYFGYNDGRFVFHNESTQSIGLQVNGYSAENGLLVYSDKVAFVNNVVVTGSLNVSGSITGSLFGTASHALTASYALNGGGTTVNTGSFATTGSNTFVGNQIISGAVNVTGLLTVQNAIVTPSGQYFVASSDTSTEMSWSVPFAPSIAVHSGIGTGPSGTSIANTSTDSNGDALPTKYWNFNMDGTTTVPGNLTGAANLATTGSVTFTGNQIVTGSTRGNVTALSITSNTASMDLSVGNFFTLQLVSGSNTYINPSNILPGQTSILTLSTTGSATVSWPSSVKQPSGSAYVPTTTTGIDIITLASVNTSSLYVVGIKNMI